MGKEYISTIDKINNKILIVTSDNHLVVYNIDNKKKVSECYEDNSLIKNSRAIEVLSVILKTESEQKHVAIVGYNNGVIHIWEINKETKLKEYNLNEQITCMKYHEGKLFIGSNNENLRTITIENDEQKIMKLNKKGMKKIEIIGKYLIIGNIEVKLYEIETLTNVYTQKNHLFDIKGIVPLNNNEYITYSKEKNMYLCSIEKNLPIQNFVLTSEAKKVDGRYINSKELLITALLENGNVCVFLYSKDNKSMRPLQHNLMLKAIKGENISTYTDRLFVLKPNTSVNSKKIPSAIECDFIQLMEKGKLISKQQITDEVEEKKKSKKREEDGVDEKKQELEFIKESKDMEIIGKETEYEGETELETTFERKMKVMSQLTIEEMEEMELSSEGIVTNIIKGIANNNRNLIERCLSVDEENTIKKTIMNLPHKYIVELLNIVCDIFNNKPKKAYIMTIWLKNIFEQHLSYLMSIKEVSKIIGKLYVVVENRTMCYKHLLRLNGRMNLLLSQIDKKQMNQEKMKGGVYNENSDDEEEDEDNNSLEDEEFDIDDNGSLNDEEISEEYMSEELMD